MSGLRIGLAGGGKHDGAHRGIDAGFRIWGRPELSLISGVPKSLVQGGPSPLNRKFKPTVSGDGLKIPIQG